MTKKTYVLWSSDKGPIAAGDLHPLKLRAERLITDIVGTTQLQWEPVEQTEETGPDNRVALHRKVHGIGGRWINVKLFIDEVPELTEKLP
ncbi:hypothetical protein [Streptomyces sp. NPDC018584]|uniref:hypothetical protein n=1 Tax=unclassified Streptomyces TaxID=2593676 RepID=UPI0037BCC078